MNNEDARFVSLIRRHLEGSEATKDLLGNEK